MSITLCKTSGACPEQYDAVDEYGRRVGYLRLRRGYFTVQVPDPSGRTVYEASPEGDGIFEHDERERYLRAAVDAIETELSHSRRGW